MEKICWQITVAAFMQPLQYDLRSPAAKDNSITHAAVARSNLDAAIYTAGTILQLQSTMEFHRQLIHQHHLQSHLHCGNDPRVANHNEIPSATHPPAPLAIPFTLRERSYSCKAQWNSIGNSSTSTTCNPIYIAGTILELQITMEFHRQLIHQHHLQPHLQCGNDPDSCKSQWNSIVDSSTMHHLQSHLQLRERSYSCNLQWNSVDRT